MVKLYYKDKPIFGLDISLTGIKLMGVDQKKWLVEGYSSIDLDPSKVQEAFDGKDDSYLVENLVSLLSKNLIGSLASNHVAISIPTNRTYTRTFSIPVEAAKHLKEAVELEIDQYIPLPLSSLYVDYSIVETTKTTVTVCLNAAPRAVIDRCVSVAEKSGLRPCLVEPSISAVARLLEHTEDASLPTVIVDIGAATTDLAVLDGTIRVTGGLMVGGNTFTLDIAKKLKVPLESAHQMKIINGLNAGPRQAKLRSALSPSLERTLVETRKVIRYYNERIEGKHKIEQVLIVGGGSNVPGIGDYFTNELVMPARVASPWQQLNFGKLQEPPKQFRSRYITVAGLGIIRPEEIWA